MFEINRKLLMDRSVPDRIGTTLLRCDVPIQPLPKHEVLRKNFDFPEVSEGEIVRYFSQLSQMNFSIDHNFYPLGSCTMKYNPKLNDEISSNPGFANLHPLQPESTVQGALKLLFELQQYLTEITGMKGVSLAPMAGADGELAGMLMARAYLLDNGGENRKTVLIPDSAHGTNPASAVMAGFNVVTLPSDSDGNTDLNALKELANDELAGLMITLPSTLGLFDSNILDVIKIVRDSGGIVYGDGANLNALLGKVKLGEIGFDVMHSNLHKTFTQPHGGGGPGAGPVIVGPRLVPYLPAPIVVRDKENGSTIYSFHTPSDSIGKLGAFHGNFGALVRAYAYISTLGNSLDQVTTDAVINANYIKSQLSEVFDLPYDRTCMHEVVLSAKSLKRDYGISALDICKRLIDYGIHPPTMYFPLIVEEALMIEPTETESKETLDNFIDVMKKIASEAKEFPDLLHNAPHDTPNSRLDEARAARQPFLRWKKTV
tara:strand:- start:2387 stop:3847 length:1461 start_codon:yes stop_codon:yes gene_type:complete